MKRLAFFLIVIVVTFRTPAIADDTAPSESSDVAKPVAIDWKTPSADEVRKQFDTWAKSQSVTVTPEVEKFWTTEDATTLTTSKLNDAVLQSLYILSPEAAAYRDACNSVDWQPRPFGVEIKLPQVPASIDKQTFLYGTLRLALLEALVRVRMFDEAETLLAEFTAENTVDAAALRLTAAIAYHQIRKVAESKQAIDDFEKLAESDKTTPRRFVEIAKLLKEDIKQSEKENDLQSISRSMNDAHRRLEKGKTGEKTQDVEKGILEALDKSIEKLEKQLSEQQGEGEQGQQSNNPAKDSRVLRQKGPGDVADKDIGDTAGWGDLPPKEREEALLRMEREFPSHYRAIIESYFREMASSPDDASTPAPQK
ncbi:MAG: hypothetical protein LBU65_09705 [Planctomycetaceae bacterium]|jgi:hypothetical protein|nr:hypothetical protein [Planctomycetaceae bacterium]